MVFAKTTLYLHLWILYIRNNIRLIISVINTVRTRTLTYLYQMLTIKTVPNTCHFKLLTIKFAKQRKWNFRSETKAAFSIWFERRLRGQFQFLAVAENRSLLLNECQCTVKRYTITRVYPQSQSSLFPRCSLCLSRVFFSKIKVNTVTLEI